VRPYAELLEFNQPNPVRKPGFTRIRDEFPGLRSVLVYKGVKPNDGYHLYDPERIIEFAGRVGYDSTAKLGQLSVTGETMMERWARENHQSMIEFGEATFYIESSRVLSLELARHRHQERQELSQRFVKFDKRDAESMFIRPTGLTDELWSDMLAELVRQFEKYVEYREQGVSPQDARYVLPGATLTKMVVKMNVRAWKHVLRLRLHKSAQPEMQELMQQVYDQLVMVFPQSLAGALEGSRAER
jgi:thymidylate synthase (FAD)